MDDRFVHQVYVIRKKVLKLVGGTFHFFDPTGNVVFFCEMKAFKLKEDIRLFTGEDKQTEILRITARQVLDISSSYDVVDSVTGERVGVLKRKGVKSLFRDEWMISNATEQEIGSIKEDSIWLALLRRLIGIVPQTYHAEIDGTPVCTYKQHFNPFVLRMTIDFSHDLNRRLDRRLGIAAAILLCAIEGRQN